MSATLRVFLIVVMLLTSQGLAAARGQARVAGEMVLCAGDKLVTVLVDEQGQPVERLVICPDMALNMMSAVAGATPQPALSETIMFLPFDESQIRCAGRDAPMTQARDPPNRGTV